MGWLDRTHVFDQMTQVERDLLMLDNVPVGRNPDTGEVFWVPEIERYSGTYIIGRQGRGKSALVESMVEADLNAGRAVIVIDPHGDLVNNIIAELPEHRVNDTYLLDMEDEAYPFGLNLFSHGDISVEHEMSRVVNRITHLFKMLWPETEGQLNLPTFIRLATQALLSHEGSTLVDMQRFLVDPAFRSRVLSNPGNDDSLQQWWHDNYDIYTPQQQKAMVAPLRRRLDILFTGRKLIRNIVGQPQSTISFRRAIEQHKVVLIKLPSEGMDEEVELTGRLIVAQLTQAVFSFADTPTAQRPGISLYIDEFAKFALEDLAKLYSEGRKFGMKITLVHQYRGQLEPYLQEATATAQVKIAFGLDAGSAHDLAPYFPQPERIEPDDEIVEHLRKRGTDYPQEVRIFAHEYLLPLKHHVKGNEVHLGPKVEHDWYATPSWYEAPHTEDDPTGLLNSLLYRCMRERSADFDIPYPVAIGFSTVGNYAYIMSKRRRHDSRLLVGYQLPERDWHNKPWKAANRLLRFIYYLRATMQYLAEHPIGKRVPVTQADMAARLIGLPARMAYVRAAEDIALVRTLDVPRRISGWELQNRLNGIVGRTRAEYCRPKADVEAVMADEPVTPMVTVGAKTPAIPERTLNRWGKVYEP